MMVKSASPEVAHYKSMDLQKTIQELYTEKEKLERVIASLEELERCAAGQPVSTSRRGRKFMDVKERQQVSERMKRYWASHRAAREATTGVANSAGS